VTKRVNREYGSVKLGKLIDSTSFKVIAGLVSCSEAKLRHDAKNALFLCIKRVFSLLKQNRLRRSSLYDMVHQAGQAWQGVFRRAKLGYLFPGMGLPLTRANETNRLAGQQYAKKRASLLGFARFVCFDVVYSACGSSL